ncbi:MAG: hypothetical protein AAGC95_01685 [Pseudomonadota bacterium]
MTPRATDFAENTPRFEIDLNTVRRQFATHSALCPFARVYFAAKANANPAVLATLADLGCGFDVYSAHTADLCFKAGGDPSIIYYDRLDAPIDDVARAYAAGVRRFSVGSLAYLNAIAPIVPEAEILCRIRYPFASKPYKLWQTLGACAEEIVEIAANARAKGLRFKGVNTHLGTQQLDLGVWEFAIAHIKRTLDEVRAHIEHRPIINLGGALPISYRTAAPPPHMVATAIKGALWRHFGDIDPNHGPIIEIEPGRALTGPAGSVWSPVEKVIDGDPALIRLPDNVSQAVFYQMLDYGIHYPIDAPYSHTEEKKNYVLTGCNHRGDEVILHDYPYSLPVDIKVGDILRIQQTGAYCNFDHDTQDERKYMKTVPLDSQRHSPQRMD